MQRSMKKASQHNKFHCIITTPYRALCKARDFYVNSMINCSNMSPGGLQRSSTAVALPRSFSTASSARSDDNEDYRELVRAASARSRGSDLEVYVTKMRAGPGTGPRALPPRSVSVAMGRIDEENPTYSFGEDGDAKSIMAEVKSELKYPRSKSQGVVWGGEGGPPCTVVFSRFL